MHRVFQEALDGAEGRSQFIVAVIADIRGFSAFSTHHESVETAVYIKRVYIRMIDDYFPGASFYKPTGDGMLITMPYTYTEESLRQAAQAVVEGCLRCLEEFPAICGDDPMINFEVPAAIGFGIAQGPACCLTSADVVLDYSGHLLNLTSRLTDLARPRGIVMDGGFALGLLPDEQQKLFQEEQVYLPSVSEETPRTVYILKGVVEIPEAARRPVRLEQWETEGVEMTLRDWKAMSPAFRVKLPKRLKRRDGIYVEVRHAKLRQRKKIPGIETVEPVRFQYVLEANRPLVVLDLDHMLGYLRAKRLPGSANVKVVVRYVPE